MLDFWEHIFKEKQTMWGFEPAESAIKVKDFFVEENLKDILIPGIGYGRNAKIFLENGINVTGIEISKNDSLFSKGKCISNNRFEPMKGAKLFFYDAESIRREFGKFGLMGFSEMDEPIKFDNSLPPMKFTVVKCQKK
jgi:hypothetical protein